MFQLRLIAETLSENVVIEEKMDIIDTLLEVDESTAIPIVFNGRTAHDLVHTMLGDGNRFLPLSFVCRFAFGLIGKTVNNLAKQMIRGDIILIYKSYYGKYFKECTKICYKSFSEALSARNVKSRRIYCNDYCSFSIHSNGIVKMIQIALDMANEEGEGLAQLQEFSRAFILARIIAYIYHEYLCLLNTIDALTKSMPDELFLGIFKSRKGVFINRVYIGDIKEFNGMYFVPFAEYGLSYILLLARSSEQNVHKLHELMMKRMKYTVVHKKPLFVDDLTAVMQSFTTIFY